MKTIQQLLNKPDPAPAREPVEIFCADPSQGLSSEQVRERTDKGWISGKPRFAGKTEPEIAAAHIFTFFNLIFLILALMLALGGSSVKNMTFLMVAACNTVIGIIQEIRAKRAVQQLSLVAARPVRVMRDGDAEEISPQALVRDDIALFHAGDQICADGIVRSGRIQVDESLLTGEADPVAKKPGDPVLSGSVILSGHCRVQLSAVGEDSFAAGLAREAKANPRAEKGEMMKSLDKLIRVVGICLIPVGILLFWQEFRLLQLPLRESVEGTVAALVGMIPEGLYLLTSIALAASALKLSSRQVLVQDMGCIESLARVDVLCVDKTGTITEPKMEVSDLIPLTEDPPERLESILAALFTNEEPDNDTARALAEIYSGNPGWECTKRIPFTSAAKWSGGIFKDHGAFLAGAPEFILGERIGEVRSLMETWAEYGCRVLLVAAYDGIPEPGKLKEQKITPLALVLLSSPIRESAKATFDYFEAEGVSIRVISGDNPLTASRVALRAGVNGAEKYIDASTLVTDADFRMAAEQYVVFGRVTPNLKKRIIAALQEAGHTVAMTGDGVNDLLAMKQSNCSVAMASGAQAASQAASLVLLDSDFSAMPEIVAEGRRVINNIQRAAALYLVKNIFSASLALVSFLTGWSYPLMPLHLTVVGCLTIGIPSFFLAMEPNYERVTGRFLRTVLRRALPGGLTDLILVLMAQSFGMAFGLSSEQIATLSAAALAAVGLLVLWRVSQPMNRLRGIVLGAMAAALAVCFLLLREFFHLVTGSLQSNLLLTALLIMAPTVFFLVEKLLGGVDQLLGRWKARKKKS